MTFTHPPVYRTYILRFWEERTPDSDKKNSWRYSLEDTDSNVRHVFQSLDDVIVFLQKQVGQSA